jgi:hypothetical protein
MRLTAEQFLELLTEQAAVAETTGQFNCRRDSIRSIARSPTKPTRKRQPSRIQPNDTLFWVNSDASVDNRQKLRRHPRHKIRTVAAVSLGIGPQQSNPGFPWRAVVDIEKAIRFSLRCSIAQVCTGVVRQQSSSSDS